MTNLELVLNMLAEVTTAGISKKEDPCGFGESLGIARRGGAAAGVARKEVEKEMGEDVCSGKNCLEIQKEDGGKDLVEDKKSRNC